MTKRISAIILSWNRKAEITQTLCDLFRQNYRDFEVIVVDQGSTDGTIELIENEFVPQGVRLILLPKNFGVPGGRNVGAANASGDVLIFLDNDASLDLQAFSIVLAKFDEYPKVGVIGFKVLNAYSKELDLGSWVYQKNKLKDFNKEFYTYTFCGCGHAIRREIFKKVGFYWDELFFSWEESEFSLKVLHCGYSILYCPDIVVYHRISLEQRMVNVDHECRRLRNSLWVSWKYFPFFSALKETILRSFAYLVKGIQNRCFLKMVVTLFFAFSKLGLLFSVDSKIKKDVFLRFRELSDKGPVIEQIKALFSL